MRYSNAVLEEVLAAVEDPSALAEVMNRLRCYGDVSQIVVTGPEGPWGSGKEAKEAAMEKERRKADQTFYWTRPVIEHAAERLSIEPERVEFVKFIYENLFNPGDYTSGIEMPREFGKQHTGAIAASIWIALFKDKTTSWTEPTIRDFFKADAYWFGWAVGKLDESFGKYRDRYHRHNLYTKARAAGKMIDKDIDERGIREVCGRDVTGELRAQVYMLTR